MTVHIHVTFQYKCTLNKGEKTYFFVPVLPIFFTNGISLDVSQSTPAIHIILELDAY